MMAKILCIPVNSEAPVTGRDFRIYNPNHGAIYEVLEKHFIMKLRRRWHRRKSKR